MDIEKAFIDSGFKVITIWEHEFDADKEMKNTALDEYDLVEPPKIRECFYRGRCEPVKLIYDFKKKPGECGKYIDVVSLYPTVMYNDRYPIGHPQKILKPETYDSNWFGFMYCKVLPPRGLYLPVLPYKQPTKQGHKLIFGLCRTCMGTINAKCYHQKNVKCTPDCKTSKQDTPCQKCKDARKIMKQYCQQCFELRNADCTHSDSDRAITGIWTTAEIGGRKRLHH